MLVSGLSEEISCVIVPWFTGIKDGSLLLLCVTELAGCHPAECRTIAHYPKTILFWVVLERKHERKIQRAKWIVFTDE